MNPDIHIVQEHGTFTVNGNQLTVVPQSSVFETYMKKTKSMNWVVSKRLKKDHSTP